MTGPWAWSAFDLDFFPFRLFPVQTECPHIFIMIKSFSIFRTVFSTMNHNLSATLGNDRWCMSGSWWGSMRNENIWPTFFLKVIIKIWSAADSRPERPGILGQVINWGVFNLITLFMGCSAESVFQVYVSSSLCVQPTHFSFSFLEENLNSRIWENIINWRKIEDLKKQKNIYEDNNQNSFRMFKSYILDWGCTYRNRINNSKVRFGYLK